MADQQPPTSLTTARKIAQGRTADVYAWGSGQVLKLYFPDTMTSWIDHEIAVTEGANAAGAPAPAVLGRLEIENRNGVLLEALEGPTLTEALLRAPWRALTLARQMADLHLQVLKHEVASLPDVRERLQQRIVAAEGLTVALRGAALAQLAVQPEGFAVLHGDLHPSNVILTADGPMILDWVDTTRGQPAADIARTLWLLRGAVLPGGLITRRIVGIIRTVFANTYEQRMLQHLAIHPAEISAWQLPVLAARLSEGIAEEKSAILSELHRLLTP